VTSSLNYNPATGLLAGMSRDVLQANLAKAQQAYIDLLSGAKGESYSYTQGDGSKSVTYTRGNIEALAGLIQTLQSQLGVVQRARRPMRFRYR
jgi:hypothetical protein